MRCSPYWQDRATRAACRYRVRTESFRQQDCGCPLTSGLTTAASQQSTGAAFTERGVQKRGCALGAKTSEPQMSLGHAARVSVLERSAQGDAAWAII